MAASRPAIVRLLFPGSLDIFHQLGPEVLQAFVSGSINSLLLFRLKVEVELVHLQAGNICKKFFLGKTALDDTLLLESCSFLI